MESVLVLIRRWLLLFASGWFVVGAMAGESETNKPARVSVSGFGLLGNREMVRLLKNFNPDRRQPNIVKRDFVEDAAVVLFARANGQGFANTTLRGTFVLTNGEKQSFTWTNAISVELPHGFAANRAKFRVRRGIRFYYKSLEIEGLHALSAREGRSYFIGDDTLLKVRANRIFTPESLKRSTSALREELRRKGFRDALVEVKDVQQNDATGEVAVEVRVQEGLPSVMRTVAVEVQEGEGANTNQPPTFERAKTLSPDKPYCDRCEQEIKRQLQTEQYTNGHPDAVVEFSVVKRETNASIIHVDLLARVKPGPLVYLGRVMYFGNQHTHDSVLESRVKVGEGEPLNRNELERARARMARLGVFDAVNLRYDPPDGTNRNAIFEFREGKETSLSVLAGYGSYEMLRGGLEFDHHNAFGLAHDIRMRLLQSFKASSGDIQYTMPELFSENITVFLRGSGLRRDEPTFTREEYGGSIGLQRRLTSIQTDLSVHYDYEFLTALDLDNASTNFLGVTEARAATFNIELNRDRRDNPLLPHKGLKLFSKLEVGSAALGGNVDYQKIILSGSYHLDLNGGRLLHLGLMHGVTFTAGGTSEELPFNKRFFPGGENSIRGYQEGEASPLDANGKQLGAETYTQGNIEFEQLLTPAWSIVTFLDVVGFAQSREHYPWDEVLYSVGAGLRWNTMIGPIRLEYGYNLNRRVNDPVGTLHFSIGFPF